MTSAKEEMYRLGKDVLISIVILVVILGSLYAFSGRWPPMVVVESGSMMHSGNSQVGVIDPGDIVVVQEVEKDDIITYAEGRNTGHRKYGQYGDVIIFEPDGDHRATPVIHRPVLYLEYDREQDSFDVPSLGDLEYGEDWVIENADLEDVADGENLSGTIILYDYGHEDKTISIELDEIDSSGFITKGDNNPNVDQNPRHRGIQEPVKEEWVLGKARGELPWFGIIKLVTIGRTADIPRNSWINFGASIAVIMLLPFIVEISSKIYGNLSDKSKDKDIGDREKDELSNRSDLKERDQYDEEIKDEIDDDKSEKSPLKIEKDEDVDISLDVEDQSDSEDEEPSKNSDI